MVVKTFETAVNAIPDLVNAVADLVNGAYAVW